MFEDSVDGFKARWRKFATSVRIFSRVEGDPLIEGDVGGAILQMLERSAPYLATPGTARAIVNPTASELELAPGGSPHIEATGKGRAKVTGTVILRDDPFIVVDANARLVVGVEGEIPAGVQEGATVTFEPVPPIHFFMLENVLAPVSPSSDSEAP